MAPTIEQQKIWLYQEFREGHTIEECMEYHYNWDWATLVQIITNKNHIASAYAMSYEEQQEFVIANVKHPHIDGCKDGVF